MDVQVSDLGNWAKVSLHGRLDTPGVDRIETRFLASIVPPGKSVIIDLSGVDFISSMGIRMLLGGAQALRLKQSRMILFGAQPLVQESLGQVIGKLVPLVASESQARALMDS